MALLNRVGFFLYNIGLFLTMGILFVALKHYNLENPNETMEVSDNLRLALYFMVGLYIAFALLVTVMAGFQKARKKGFIFGILSFILWGMVGAMALFSLLSSILSDSVSTPGWMYGVVSISIIVAFPAFCGILLNQFPSSVEAERIVEAVKKALKKQDAEDLPFCPECKFKVEPSHKFCPNCGVKFEES